MNWIKHKIYCFLLTQKWAEEIQKTTSITDKSVKYSVKITKVQMEILRRCKCMDIDTLDAFSGFTEARRHLVRLYETLSVMLYNKEK